MYEQNLELAFAVGETGVTAIDFRTNVVAGSINTSKEATSCEIYKNNVYIGLNDGSLLIYDVRSSMPMQKIITGRNQPIH